LKSAGLKGYVSSTAMSFERLGRYYQPPNGAACENGEYTYSVKLNDSTNHGNTVTA